MARRSRATGIGRGNGSGSRATQFQAGEPSGNPKGRPTKRARPPAPDLLDLFWEALAKKVPVTRHGQREMMSQDRVLVEGILAAFHKASLNQQLRLVQFLDHGRGQDRAQVDRTATPQSIAEFVAGLAEEAAADEAARKELGW